MPTIGIILGSTRPHRVGDQVARWVLDHASHRTDADFALLDLRDHPLPHLDEPMPPSLGQYQNEHTRRWAETIAAHDGFVIVTPEYNHGIPGVLKNALDYLYTEWNNKALGLVSYGAAGGVRSAEHLRLVAGELQMADVRQQVALSLITEFENFSVFRPGDHSVRALDTMLDQVLAWTTALAPLRAAPAVATTMTGSPADLMRVNLLEVFGEPDADRRAAVIAEHYAEDVVWHEPDRVNHGRTEFVRRAAELLAETPDWVFRPTGPASELDDIGHLGFHYGPADGRPPGVSGMDIARTRDGVIIELYTIITGTDGRRDLSGP